MDLVILAGGMGNRFGGLKQIVPIDNYGNFIIDYSIFDAIRAGFDRVVIVTKRENLQDFKNTIGKRLENKINVEYVFQDLDSFIDKNKYNISNRIKPWGTAHAILCSRDVVKNNFAIINADDFYGATTFKQMADYLKNNKEDNTFALAGFKVNNTLSENGGVKRGICVMENGNLKELKESLIEKENGNLLYKVIDSSSNSSSEYKKLGEDNLVSMNLFGFTPKVFDLLEEGFYEFLEDNKNNLETCEYFIPTILTENINKGKIKIKTIPTSEKWFGLTYKSDFDIVKNGIQNLTNLKVYPINLWEN